MKKEFCSKEDPDLTSRKAKHRCVERRRRHSESGLFEELRQHLRGPKQRVAILRDCLRLVKKVQQLQREYPTLFLEHHQQRLGHHPIRLEPCLTMHPRRS